MAFMQSAFICVCLAAHTSLAFVVSPRQLGSKVRPLQKFPRSLAAKEGGGKDVIVDIPFAVDGQPRVGADGETTGTGSTEAAYAVDVEDKDLPPNQLSTYFGVLKTVTSCSIWLSFLLDYMGKRPSAAPVLAIASTELHKWIWTLISTSYVYDTLTSAAKRDKLGTRTSKILNVGIVMSVLLLFGTGVRTGTTIPVSILYCLALPCMLALSRTGIRDMLKPMRFINKKQGAEGMLSTMYAVLAWEALISAFQRPSSLPFLRAAILHRLHHAAAAEPEHRLGSDTAIKLNDALMYASFTIFPAGFMAKPRLCREVIVPVMSLVAAIQGGTIGKKIKKDQKAAADLAAAEATAGAEAAVAR